VSCAVEADGGNREMSPLYLFDVGPSGVGVEVHFPHANEPKAREEPA
jgi:hypothetical protein